MMAPLDFAKAMLLTLNLPVTENNVQSLVAWIAMEGGHYANNALFNPLNTTQSMPGSRAWGGSIPIQVYPNWEVGLAGTVKTLRYGMYEKIRNALARSASPDETLTAIDNTPWGTHLYIDGKAKGIGPANWVASGMRLSDPHPNEGGGLAILGQDSFLGRLRNRAPLLGILGIAGAGMYYLIRK